MNRNQKIDYDIFKYIRVTSDPSYPSMDEKTKKTVLDYMKNGIDFFACPSILKDKHTGLRIRNLNEDGFCDGVYYWTTESIYYIEKYNEGMPEEFIRHVLS